MSYVTLVYSVSVNANNSLSISEYFFETSKTHVPYADEHSRRFVKISKAEQQSLNSLLMIFIYH